MAFDPTSPNHPSQEGEAAMNAILENFLQLRKFESGSSAPANPVAGMFWVDTTSSPIYTLKVRNSDNTAWISIWTFNATDTVITILNAILTTPTLASFYQDTARTKLMTVPNVASDTVVLLAAVQTLVNKTLTAPTIADLTNMPHTHGSDAQGGTIGGSLSAGNYILIENNTERTTLAGSYTKLKEAKLGSVSGTLRISFDMKADQGFGFGRVYRNDVAVGTQRSDNTGSYVTFVEDIAGWSPGDTVQIYAYDDTGSDLVYIRNFVIGVDPPPIAGNLSGF
jgi:hypothetical protein